MAHTLTVEMQNTATLRPGQRVKGIVRALWDGVVACEALTLTLGVEVSGSGERGFVELGSQEVFSGQAPAGRHVYAFELELPDTELSSYSGHLFSASWQVRAEARLPKQTISDTATFTVEGSLTTATPPEPGAAHDKSVALDGGKWLMIGGGIAALLGALFLLFVLTMCETWTARGIFSFFGVCCLLIGGAFARVGWQLVKSQQAIHEATLHAPWPSTPGTEVPCRVSLTPARDLWASEVVLLLVGEEVIERGGERDSSGEKTETRTLNHKIHSQSVTLSERVALRVGQPLTFEGAVRLPDDAPRSVELFRDKVRWHVTVLVKLEQWPDWSVSRPLWVRAAGKTSTPGW